MTTPKENGTGYPDGLTSYDITRSSKITAIADVFSALTTNRSYRGALPKEQAIEIMYGEMDGSFDKQYLDTFRSTLFLDTPPLEPVPALPASISVTV